MKKDYIVRVSVSPNTDMELHQRAVNIGLHEHVGQPLFLNVNEEE
jgi:hypothetical protein